MTNLIFNKKVNSIERQSFIWNMLASLLYAGMAPFLLAITKYVSGEQNAGMFSVAFSVTQLLVIIGNFEVRPIHASDNERKFEYQQYFENRIVTVLLMILVGEGYCFFTQQTEYSIKIILIIVVFRISECVSDVIEGEYQRNNLMFISGRLQFFKNLISIVFLFYF